MPAEGLDTVAAALSIVASTLAIAHVLLEKKI
jgi:hypothetical protein